MGGTGKPTATTETEGIYYDEEKENRSGNRRSGSVQRSCKERTAHRVIASTTTTVATSQLTESITNTAAPTTASPMTTTVGTATEPQSTTTVTCATTEITTATMEQATTADTTVQPTTTTTPAPAEPYHGQTSGDYIYVNGFGWIFNEGGGGEGSVNYEMYCNGNKIGYPDLSKKQ